MVCYVFILILSLVIGYIFVYNKIVRLKNLLIEAESGIDVQLKRRYDLVPNLVKVAAAYCKHEAKTLEDVIRQRGNAMSKKTLSEKEDFENQFEQSLCAVLMLKENYPDLKANDLFLKLQKDLIVIEDDLNHARRYYNGVVRTFNTFINLFPVCCFKKSLKVSDYAFFQLDGSHEKNAPNIKDYLS